MEPVDRPELRFKMLLEYYKEEHGIDGTKYDDANKRIRDMDVSDDEKSAAQRWLIDSVYVVGETYHFHGGASTSIISRINSSGVNFVEQIVDNAFVKIKDNIPDVGSSITEKIQKFIKECSEHPVTSEIGRIILDAVIGTMTELIR